MANNRLEVQGHCESGFEAVLEAFIGNFEEHNEVGAAASVVVEGETVVDIWAGHMDADKTKPWQKDTIVQVMSATKGIVSLLAHQLVEQGTIDLDAPVATYWPDFAEGGKAELPVRYLLTHQAGLPAVEKILPAGSTTDWDLMTKTLAAKSPEWEPGETFGYHALTFGWLVGQVIRGATGKRLGELIREKIASPLGVDFLLGFGPEHDDRVADLVDAPQPPPGMLNLVSLIMEDLDSLLARSFVPAMPNPAYGWNTRASRSAEMPAANGHTNARALARIYGILAQGGSSNGTKLIDSDTLAQATTKQVGGIDEVMNAEMNFGLGFLIARPAPDRFIGPRTFGHSGMGGSVGLADPDRKLGFSYVMNQLGLSTSPFFTKSTTEGVAPPDPRAANILKAVYGTL
ncbi:MAG: beta-lactamase family protein [Proteobacteria bacterium]|nr:beta-lactamase family protein [Pseudomonadota bacterium]